jgi:HSP20 family protein
MALLKVRKGTSFQDIQDEMNRMIQRAFEDLGVSERVGPEGSTWSPAVELNEQDGTYQLKAELPGVNKDDIDIEVGEDWIILKAETKQSEEEKEKNIYRSEIRYGKFIRSIPLPSAVDNSQAKAEYKDGILTVTVPKSEEEQKRIKKLSIE